MPKKHHNRVLFTKPASSAPDTFSARNNAGASSNASQNATPSVNDLLRDARRVQAASRTSDGAATASLPPALRAVFNLPPPPQLAAQQSVVRTQVNGLNRSRRIPGPPPPRSWLQNSDNTQSHTKLSFQLLRWIRARVLQEPATLPGALLPREDSLLHHVLKRMASHWAWHAEYDNIYLTSLPVITRLLLINYIAIYDDAHWPNPLLLLFPPDSPQEDLDAVSRLDLANSLGSWASTTRKIEKELVLSGHQTSANHKIAIVPDSWDQDIPQGLDFDRARFINLKHLSLAVNVLEPSISPSWATLIGMSSHLSRLESLSLAHWPLPTYTPNAARGRYKIVDSTGIAAPQVFGGTNMYSADDDDWREATGILKSLSRNLYCLKWLDLSGCASWLPALTWSDESNDNGPDWNGSWRNIETLILRVGWLPGRPMSREELDATSSSLSTTSIESARAIEQLYGHSEAIQRALEHLAELRLGDRPATEDADDLPWNVEHEREKEYLRRDLETWRKEADVAREIMTKIKAVRRAGAGRYIDVVTDDPSTQHELGS